MPINNQGNEYQIVPRIRHDRFLIRFIDELRQPGTSYRAALLRAAKKTWGNLGGSAKPPPDRYFEKKGKAVLANPTVINAVAQYLETTLGWTQGDTLELWLKHIRGDHLVHKHAVVNGELVRWTEPAFPDAKMLIELAKLTIEQPTQKHQIDQRAIIMSQITATVDDAAIPEMIPRKLPIEKKSHG